MASSSVDAASKLSGCGGGAVITTLFDLFFMLSSFTFSGGRRKRVC
jgi:hypothetical protein